MVDVYISSDGRLIDKYTTLSDDNPTDNPIKSHHPCKPYHRCGRTKQYDWHYTQLGKYFNKRMGKL